MRVAALVLAVNFLLGATAAAAAAAPGPDLGKSSIERGEEVYKAACRACHSMKYLGYRAIMTPEAGKAAFGKVPPDLSLMASARGRGSTGAGYIMALLGAYNNTPSRNSVFPNLAMPPPFSPGDPGAGVKSGEVAAFLYWASDPSFLSRERIGKFVVVFMVLFTLILYRLDRRTWKGIKGRGNPGRRDLRGEPQGDAAHPSPQGKGQ